MSQLQRFFIELSYKGTAFHGWQVQPNAVTVQQVLDKALSTVLRQNIETTGCGRTDTGVHARQFFAHFDAVAAEEKIDESKTVQSLNGLLPLDIVVKSLIPVHPEAHARFDATSRSYEYHIHFFKDPFKSEYSWLLRDRLNVEAMNAACAILREYRDFSCFSKSHTQVFTNNCSITEARWEETGGGLIFHISADRFLRNMVRAVVGTMIWIGKETMPPEAIRNIIESKNRSQAGTSVPACGLYLTKVEY